MKISTGTIVRTIMMVIAAINTLCAAFGFTTIDIDENTLYTVCTGLFDVITLVVVWWKNNNFSKRELAIEEVRKVVKEDGIDVIFKMLGMEGK